MAPKKLAHQTSEHRTQGETDKPSDGELELPATPMPQSGRQPAHTAENRLAHKVSTTQTMATSYRH